jgi:TatD DNase family protein
MIETDAPYLLPRDMGVKSSTKNEPRYLPHIAKKVAKHRSEDFKLLINSIYMNSLKFFNLKN